MYFLEKFKKLNLLNLINLLLISSVAFSQETQPLIKIKINADEILEVKKEEKNIKIKIDGKLDEKVWKSLTAYDPYKVTEPDTLKKPLYETKTRFFYTSDGFYFSMEMEQPKSTLVRRFKSRDDFDTKSDRVGFSLDTSGNGKYAYWFSVSLGDSQADGTLMPERIFSSDWDGAWYGASAETENGWSVEYYIPWSQVAMPKVTGDRIVNIHSIREVAHLNETWAWPALPSSMPQFISLFQPTKMNNVDLKSQWSVFPYSSSSYDRITSKNKIKAGADLFWRPSTNTQLTATLNPDFGSVEADNVVVNLSANETFFPEKRLFFQEGIEVFTATPRASDSHFGGRNKITVLNTRRIGSKPTFSDLPDGVEFDERTEKTTKADLNAAVKATGQIGKFRYGVLFASEADTNLQADDNNFYNQNGRDFGVARLLYENTDNGDTRGFGFLSTLVTKPETDSVVNAFDFHYLSKAGKWKTDGQYILSNTQADGTGQGGFFDIVYTPEQGKIHKVITKIFDENMEINDLGFNRRNDLKEVIYNYSSINSSSNYFRNTKFEVFFNYGENFKGQRVSGWVGTKYNVKLNNLSEIEGLFLYSPERYEDRESYDNGTFKRKHSNRLSIEFKTDPSKEFSYGGQLTYQEQEYDGAKSEGTFKFTWFPKGNISFQTKLKYVDGAGGWLLHQQERDFTTFFHQKWETDFKFNYFINAKQQLSLNIQWVGIQAQENNFYVIDAEKFSLNEINKPYSESDNFSISDLNIQLRYRWQIAPLSDVYFVATKSGQNREKFTSFDELARDTFDNPISDQIILKIRYRFGS